VQTGVVRLRDRPSRHAGRRLVPRCRLRAGVSFAGSMRSRRYAQSEPLPAQPIMKVDVVMPRVPRRCMGAWPQRGHILGMEGRVRRRRARQVPLRRCSVRYELRSMTSGATIQWSSVTTRNAGNLAEAWAAAQRRELVRGNMAKKKFVRTKPHSTSDDRHIDTARRRCGCIRRCFPEGLAEYTPFDRIDKA